MLFHPLINRLANIPLTYLVKPADEQRFSEQTACFCPFCRQKRTGNGVGEIEKQNEGGSETPHFIIYNNERGGLYNGVGIDNNKQADFGAVKWMCTRTGRSGYGAIELYAAIHKLPIHGHGLLKVCHDLVVHVYGDTADVRKEFPELFAKMDYRTIAPQRIDTFSFIPKADFTPQELTALGCEVTIQKGIFHFGFGGTWMKGESDADAEAKAERRKERFWPCDLNDDFRIYSVDKVILPAVNRKVQADGVTTPSSATYQTVSEIIHGTPWNPLFVCFATDEINATSSCGCIFRPAMKSEPIVFSLNEDHSVRKVSKWLMGDRVFTYAMDHRSEKSTAVHSAIMKFDDDEQYTEEREVWIENEDKEGNPKGTFRKEMEPIPIPEIKARNIVFCRTPQDAVATYYAMRSLRTSNPTDRKLQQQCWYHVAFMVGRRNYWYIDQGKWQPDSLDFKALQYQKMNRFAERVILLYPNDIDSQRDCGTIAVKFEQMCYATLPHDFRNKANQRWQWCYGRSPRSVRDYLLTMQMGEQDGYAFDHDIRQPLFNELRNAKCTDPFDIVYPRDARSGRLMPPKCKVSPTKLWIFMSALGYYREIDPKTTDKIGEYIHLDRCFVEYIDVKSVIHEAKRHLNDFIKRARNRTDEERDMMSDCAYMLDKTFTQQSASGLQSMIIDFKESFSQNVEHFFFDNCAVRITPDSISTVKYEDINFFVPATARKPYDFSMPNKSFFAITENPEYQMRLQEIEGMKTARDIDGMPVYQQHDIDRKEADLNDWQQTYRWSVDWYGRKEPNMLPALRIIRGCCNVLWREEQLALREKKELPEEEQAVINAHFANIISAIGRVCYRSWRDMEPICPYLLEDNIPDEHQATGGSGKSVLINIICGCAVNVFSVDTKRFKSEDAIKFALAEVQAEKGKWRAVHWEDWKKGLSLDNLYNNITGGTTVERKFGDAKHIDLADSPIHVVTSNYPLSDDASSTVGRFPLVSFSDRFARANNLKHQPARRISDLMKGFNTLGPKELPANDRNQIIYICALAVQFLMKYKTFALAPQQNVRRRQMVQKLTESIVRYFEWFFSRPEVYGTPICTDEMFNEFLRSFADSSDSKKSEYSRATFKKKIYDYCENLGIICNPKHLFQNDSDKQRKCFKLQAWVTQEYFVGREWENDHTVEPKTIRYLQTSKHVFFFYRPTDKIPASYADLKRIAKAFAEQPDPLPYRDEEGHIVTLTDEEKSRWEDFVSRKQGKRWVASAAPTPETKIIEVDVSEMPF